MNIKKIPSLSKKVSEAISKKLSDSVTNKGVDMSKLAEELVKRKEKLDKEE